MHIGSLLGFLRDRHDRRAQMIVLLDPSAVGFTPWGPELAWAWLLEQARARITDRTSIFVVVIESLKFVNVLYATIISASLNPGCPSPLARTPDAALAPPSRRQ